MVWTGHFEKFLEMVFWLPHLVLEIMLDDHDILLIEDVRFLVIIIAAGSDYDSLGLRWRPQPDAVGNSPATMWRWCR
jgi:hypothetical protein